MKLIEPIGRNLFTPGVPLRISTPAVVGEPGGQPFLGALSSQSGIGPGEGYSIDAAISSVTEKQLQNAGEDYPASVRALYLDDSNVTPEVRALAKQIVQDANAKTPYDMAKALAHFLTTSPDLSYATNVGAPPADRDLVDFFLFDAQSGRRGYCQYYASAMAVMARSLGLPARVAVGFSPGTLIAPSQYEYRESNAHVWAQVFFPGYGWQTFEATKSIDPQFIRDSGTDQTLPPPVNGADDATQRLLEGQDPSNVFTQPSVRPIPGGTVAGGSDQPTATGDARTGNLLVILLILVAVAVAVGWRMRRSWRRLRFLAPGERQWALLLQAADRAGVSQRASETDLRVRRMARGADTGAAPGDQHHRPRQGVGELLGAGDDRGQRRPHEGRLAPPPSAVHLAGGPSPPPVVDPASGQLRRLIRSERQWPAVVLIGVHRRATQQVRAVVPAHQPPSAVRPGPSARVRHCRIRAARRARPGSRGAHARRGAASRRAR